MDPAIHQLLAYEVNAKEVDVALGKTDELDDLENLTLRSQLRIMSADMQKGVFAAEQMRGSKLLRNTPLKGVNENDTPLSGEKRPLQTWDANKPMSVEDIKALNAAKKSKSNVRGGRVDAFFKKTNVGQISKTVGIKRDAPERDEVEVYTARITGLNSSSNKALVRLLKDLSVSMNSCRGLLLS